MPLTLSVPVSLTAPVNLSVPYSLRVPLSLSAPLSLIAPARTAAAPELMTAPTNCATSTRPRPTMHPDTSMDAPAAARWKTRCAAGAPIAARNVTRAAQRRPGLPLPTGQSAGTGNDAAAGRGYVAGQIGACRRRWRPSSGAIRKTGADAALKCRKGNQRGKSVPFLRSWSLVLHFFLPSPPLVRGSNGRPTGPRLARQR
jgi:hypothetical protein